MPDDSKEKSHHAPYSCTYEAAACYAERTVQISGKGGFEWLDM